MCAASEKVCMLPCLVLDRIITKIKGRLFLRPLKISQAKWLWKRSTEKIRGLGDTDVLINLSVWRAHKRSHGRVQS